MPTARRTTKKRVPTRTKTSGRSRAIPPAASVKKRRAPVKRRARPVAPLKVPSPITDRHVAAGAWAISESMSLLIVLAFSFVSAAQLWGIAYTGAPVATDHVTPYRWVVAEYSGARMLLPRSWTAQTYLLDVDERVVESVVLTNGSERTVVYTTLSSGPAVLGVSDAPDETAIDEAPPSDVAPVVDADGIARTFVRGEATVHEIVGDADAIATVVRHLDDLP